MIVREEQVWQEHHGWSHEHTTANRMELQAALSALGFVHRKWGAQYVRIWSDSAYVINGMNEGWYELWEKRNFLAGPPGGRYRAKNLDLWGKLHSAAKLHKQVAWAWVKGHSGHPANERVDKLAYDARFLGEVYRMENWN